MLLSRTFGRLSPRDDETRRLATAMALFFVMVCAVGILRPIRNALALEGLGATKFYRVYLVSAAVALVVPLYDRLADRVPWRRLVRGLSLFFALDLLVFHFALGGSSPALGLLFYAWFDIFSAVMVAQFFAATQFYFTAREARRAYPVVVAGGALGASLGGATTAVLAPTIGARDLLLLAALLVTAFGLAMPHALASALPAEAERAGVRRRERPRPVRLAELARHPHVRLIALGVLLAAVVKQLIDYEFNALTFEIFRTRDAVSAFQGSFDAATQWLPLLALLGLRPLLRRRGVGAVVLLLPAALLGGTLGLALLPGLWSAAAAKALDTTFRHSAERTGREVLYIPLPRALKLKAKAYIDVGLENGLGKVLAAGVIFLLLRFLDRREIALVGVGFSVLWLLATLAVRREYVRVLARAVEGRFATLTGVASVADATTRPVIHRVLAGGDALQRAFVLDLLDQSGGEGVRPFAPDLHRVLESPEEELRVRALAVLGREPEAVEPERVRALLSDPSPTVRQAAVRLLCATDPAGREGLLEELLASPEPGVRVAALTCLTLEEFSAEGARMLTGPYLERRRRAAEEGDGTARLELALAAGAPGAAERDVSLLLPPLLGDRDPAVASAALRSAGLRGTAEMLPRMIAALGHRATREAARDALAAQGARAVDALSAALLDPAGDPVVRRNIPPVLGRIAAPESVEALLVSYAAPETDQLLDYRTLKALSRLRTRHPELRFDPAPLLQAVAREAHAAARYAAAASLPRGGAATELLRRALEEGWRERRESVFRCLGLLHPPRETYRCYRALIGGSAARRANALEWLEQTTGRPLFLRIAPVIEPDRPTPSRSADALLRELWDDDDPWIARLALWVGAEQRLDGICGRLERLRAGPDPERAAFARRLLARLEGSPTETDMDLVEKVFLLQQIDLLRGARSAHLSLLASIAEEVDADDGAMLIERGEPTEALYVVISGTVHLHGFGAEPVVASEGMSFGSWALIDDAESPVEARCARPSHLLRITRDDFQDLLADHPELAMGLLQGLARRVRSLVA